MSVNINLDFRTTLVVLSSPLSSLFLTSIKRNFAVRKAGWNLQPNKLKFRIWNIFVTTRLINHCNKLWKGARAHLCPHIKTGFLSERYFFLSTSYCLTTGILLSGLKSIVLWPFKKKKSIGKPTWQGNCRSHIFCFSRLPIRYAFSSSERTERLWLIAHRQCQVSNAYSECLRPICEVKNKL